MRVSGQLLECTKGMQAVELDTTTVDVIGPVSQVSKLRDVGVVN